MVTNVGKNLYCIIENKRSIVNKCNLKNIFWNWGDILNKIMTKPDLWTYWKGLTPECVSMCILRLDLFWNILPQRSQVKAPTMSRWCTSLLCRCKAAREPRTFRQCLHWNSRRTSRISAHTSSVQHKCW